MKIGFNCAGIIYSKLQGVSRSSLLSQSIAHARE
ncbi:MAG: hypothetical protein QOH24_2365, partial [Verrucomicrobiota bacterium]